MKKIISSLIVLVLFAAFIVPSAFADGVVRVYNWYDYMDETVFDDFTAETGIKVEVTYFTTCEDMMVQMQLSPGAYDVVFPSDYCIERMIAEDMLAELDFDQLPNAEENTLDWLYYTDYDPNHEYSVPFMWGTVGILYNTTMVDEEDVHTWGVLWNEKYANSILMLKSIRDTMGTTLKYLGYSMNTRDEAQLSKATQALIAQKPLVKAYYVDESKDEMAAGSTALAVVWSGDALYAMEQNEDLDYVVPDEGSNVWVDAMVVPKNAENYENALMLIDFLCRPEIAQRNCEYIWYSSPNFGAIELMGEEYEENPTINPSDEIIANCEFFHDIPDEYLSVYNTYWSQIINAK
ncbi:MAG: spermidine/putrescine ABC transporter substrate-binding protein [Clostridiales bacterium]|nr:spermidine/putrescine ABC transporter substrate-binding protein [Clostridiales bacterium]